MKALAVSYRQDSLGLRDRNVCNQMLIDTAMKLLTINSSTLKSVAMGLYGIIQFFI